MIDSRGLSYTELTHFLGEPSTKQVREWQSTTVRDWAYENMVYRTQVYDIPDNGKIGYEYRYKNMNLVEKRLLQAGVRLAGLLNQLYG